MIGSEEYVWQFNGHKNLIFNESNEDMLMIQVEGETQYLEKINSFSDITDYQEHIKNKSIYVSGLCWPVLMAVSIKYAEQVGVEISEVKNWREYIKKFGWNGKIERDSELDFRSIDFKDARIPSVDESPTGFGYMRPTRYDDTDILPVIDSLQRLVFCVNNSKNKKEPLFITKSGDEFYPQVYFVKEEAHHLFKAAVNGMMDGEFSERPMILVNLLWEYEQAMNGKSLDEIMRTADRS